MSFRSLFPMPVRKWWAASYVRQAERAEQRADLHAGEVLENFWAAEAIRSYVRAWRWVPVEHPHQFPEPELLGEQAMDEQLWPEAYEELQRAERMTCVLCGVPIPARKVGEDREGPSGLYCAKCA